MNTAKVILFKLSGKYYTEEEWRIPKDAIGPYDMISSPDFRRIDGGAVLVETQEPWGFPHLFPYPTSSRVRSVNALKSIISYVRDDLKKSIEQDSKPSRDRLQYEARTRSYLNGLIEAASLFGIDVFDGS